MTGEISLRGRVLAIGGLKEKTMAALRHGITTVVIPKDNAKDLEQIDQTVRQSLNFVLADTVDVVLATALNRTTEVLDIFPSEITTVVKQHGSKPCIRQ
jgi:ATP-dependent Lon protease